MLRKEKKNIFYNKFISLFVQKQQQLVKKKKKYSLNIFKVMQQDLFLHYRESYIEQNYAAAAAFYEAWLIENLAKDT